MRKFKFFCGCLMFSLLFAFICAGKTIEIQDPVTLDFGTFKVQVEKSGKIKSIMAGDKIIIYDIMLFAAGQYKGLTGDPRVFQGNAKEQNPDGKNAVLTTGKDSITIDRHGVQGNAQYSNLFDYVEKIVIDAEGTIKIKVAVKMLVVLDTGAVPQFMMNLPTKNIVDRGMKIISARGPGQITLKVLTPEYNEAIFCKEAARKLEISMESGLFSMEGKDGTWFMINDARGWKGGNTLQISTGHDKFKTWKPGDPAPEGDLEIKLPVKKGVLPVL